MYMLNTDEIRALMLETEAEIISLLRRFEVETGLTVADIDLYHYKHRLGENPRHQRKLLEVRLRPVLI